MAQALAPIRADMAQLSDRLTAVEASTQQLRRMAAIVESLIFFFQWFLTDEMQTWNRSLGSGKDTRVEVVLFPSGEDPTTAPVCLLNPCLGNATYGVEHICLSTIYQLFPL
jgi:hypothetical protein